MTRTHARRLKGWITLLAFSLAVLAPVLSRARAAQAPGGGAALLIEVCSSDSVRVIAWGDAAPADAADVPAPAPIDLDHCGLCVLLAHGLAPPAAAIDLRFSPCMAFLPDGPVQCVHQAIYGTAQARAPPGPSSSCRASPIEAAT